MMMAPEYYVWRSGKIPDHVTHVLIDRTMFVPRRAFCEHPNIQEVICYDGVKKIGRLAFYKCPRLQRVIMPGVKVIAKSAFNECRALNYVECSKLEIIGGWAFGSCRLSSVDLPSIKTVEKNAFYGCWNLTNAKFGKDLESIGEWAFKHCSSLERITLPLKNDVITNNNTFQGCVKLEHVDLVEKVHEVIAALNFEERKTDLSNKLDSINHILASVKVGGKTQAIRVWMKTVLRKISHYANEHRHCLNVAAAALQPALTNDILFKSIFPFIELPHTRLTKRTKRNLH